ncbi:C45 family autoproteolytic acyltransferase/hydrolase [Asanoa sp. WMMD1127]|uniref:C45 family autoproteolytic acyltransferase/hydolase n=1 Tax=Asanoa sp. WMMD1127 TaxID=3016107 RepID=UPI00241794B1|nr:C45 family peptidase [Asanoa sp. WMMD1127]MDG4821587.1 C45 family autoproteolytic acyltransferase/hydrolase [Asanoa sp. WMMD1127]
MTLPVPYVDVSGTPGEIGFAYGRAARDQIAANLDLYAGRFRAVGLTADVTEAAGETFRAQTRRLFPRIAEMLDGTAEGAGVTTGDLYAVNARTELIYGTPPDGATGACTVLGALGTHTATGHTLLAQNWDWHPDQRHAMVLLSTTDERGHRVVALTEAGMLAKTGLNSAGLGICVNMLGTDRDGASNDNPGIPYHVVLRAALESDTLGRALKKVVPAPRNASLNLLLGQSGPAGGELIDLELVPGVAGWLHPEGGVLAHANHLETALPGVRDTVNDFGGSTLFRGARARRLLTAAAEQGKLTDDDLLEILRDHQSHPNAICRHVDELDAYADRSETVYTVVMDLDDRRIGIAEGPPCHHELTWLELPAENP